MFYADGSLGCVSFQRFSPEKKLRYNFRMSEVEKIFNNHKEELRQVVEIITVFNRIENIVVIFVSSAFASVYDGQERIILMNDVLNDVNIFETFNQKLNFLEKTISRVAMIAKRAKEAFDEKKYLNVCKSIRDIQRYRNKIAHMSLMFSPEGKAVIFKRKKDKELLVTKGGSFNREELDLNNVTEKVWAVYKTAEEVLLKEGIKDIINILLKEELVNFYRTSSVKKTYK